MACECAGFAQLRKDFRGRQSCVSCPLFLVETPKHRWGRDLGSQPHLYNQHTLQHKFSWLEHNNLPTARPFGGAEPTSAPCPGHSCWSWGPSSAIPLLFLLCSALLRALLPSALPGQIVCVAVFPVPSASLSSLPQRHRLREEGRLGRLWEPPGTGRKGGSTTKILQGLGHPCYGARLREQGVLGAIKTP